MISGPLLVVAITLWLNRQRFVLLRLGIGA